MADTPPPGEGEILLYRTPDGSSRVECRLVDGQMWLSQARIGELFQVAKSSVSEHLKAIYAEGELDPGATVRKLRTVQTEGAREVTRRIEHHGLDAVVAVGFRVRSPLGTAFRRWANDRLREYLTKGFAMDDQRLKEEAGGGYFDELLARIRDIRSSEKVFWRKVLDIYATSIDYDPKAEASVAFFRTVQNKLHWATHGQTAAEVILRRADASQTHMGLTTWAGGQVRKGDVGTAKNYLTPDELEVLNRVVTAYLELAELQALNRQPMHMADWAARLDDFLKLTGRELLTHAGKVTHAEAIESARTQYEAYRERLLHAPSPVEQHFLDAAEEIKRLERERKRNPPAKPSPDE